MWAIQRMADYYEDVREPWFAKERRKWRIDEKKLIVCRKYAVKTGRAEFSGWYGRSR